MVARHAGNALMPVWNTKLHYQMSLELSLWWQSVNPFLQNNNLIGYWPGLINSAGKITDFSHNQRHLTNNGVTAVTTSPPHHLDFSSGDYLELTSTPNLVGNFTFGGWFKFAAPTDPTGHALITKGDLDIPDASRNQALYIGPASSWGTDSLIIRTGIDDEVMFSGVFGEAIPLNEWCFLAGGLRQLSGSTNKYILRINDWGIDFEDTFTENAGNSLNLRIGTDINGDYPFIGQMAKFWAVAEAFDQNILNDIYNHQKHRFGA